MTGKALLVNLTDRTCTDAEIDGKLLRQYIGGRGMCGYFLNKYLDEDPLVFFTGPLSGSGYQMTDRCSVAHISPYTGGLFRSDFGGSFAASLKAAGYDGIVITGKLSDRGAIVIDGGAAIYADIPEDCSCVKPGKAAELDIKHAGIICDGMFRTNRGSTGYVMHARNLTAIAVKRPADDTPKTADDTSEDIERLINASPALTGRLSIKNYGTAALYDLACARGMLPHNFSNKIPDPKSNAYAMLRGKHSDLSCGHCAVACKKISGGIPLPDYDDFAMLLAAGIDMKDIPDVYRHCFIMGYDIISMCHSIFRTGCDREQAKDMISGYSTDSPLMNIKTDLKVKGLEIPAFDPRGAMGMALGYAVSPIGADWRGAMAITHEILRKPVATDRLSLDGKAVINLASENAEAAADSLNVCRYALFSASLEEYAKALNTVTGEDFTPSELSSAGAEIIKNEMNITRRLGYSEKDDTLPEIFFNEGTDRLKPINKSAFMDELEKYRKLRGIA